jgi:hypothetical protein
MKAICLVSFFSQNVSGTKDSVIEIQDQQTFDELEKSGYIQAMDSQSQNSNVARTPQELQTKSLKNKKATAENEGK